MTRFWKPATAVAAVALFGTVLAAHFAQAGETTGKVSVGAPAVQFKLQDQNGKDVSLSDYAGKIVVIEWTNPECPVVQGHYKAKTMTTLQSQYKPQGVVWLAINSSGDTTNGEDLTWAKAQNIDYPILNDVTGTTGKAYGATNTPQMFIIDKQGAVVYDGAIDNDPHGSKGADKINYVTKALDEVLSGKPVSVSQTKPYGCAVHYAN